MRYLDFDVEISPGVGRDYPVAARSAAGQTHGTMRFPFDTLELENALLKLEKALLQSGGTRRKAVTVEEEDVQRFGQALFEALLVGDLRSLYYESKREATRQGQGLRVRLHIRVPELAALPWEYLYDPRVPDYLGLSRSTPLVRYLDLAHPIEPLSVAPPLQILAMIASPSDQDALDTTRERERMRQALSPLEQRGLVKLTWLEGQTWRDLQRAMRSGPWHIFHFIGHGAFDRRIDEGALALAEDNGQTYLLHATPLGRLLANHSPLRLVVLNACEGAKGGQRDLFSSTAATLAQRGIPAVLAMQYEISDRAAVELTSAFYESLADGLPVDAALAETRTSISLGVNNTLEWGTPVLYLRAQDGVLFEMTEMPAPPVAEPKDASSLQASAAPVVLPPMDNPQLAVPLLPNIKTKEDWLQEGDTLVHYTAKRYEEALVCYDQALALDPTFARAHSGKAQALKRLGRNEEAVAESSRAIQLDPQLAKAHAIKGLALWHLGRKEEALVACERATQLDPKEVLAYFSKGLALGSLNRNEEAVVAFEQAIQLDPQDAEVYLLKGLELGSLKRHEEALATYEQAIQLDPQDAGAYESKGETLSVLGHHREALEAYDRAIQLKPQEARTYFVKSKLLADLGRYDEALAAWEQAIKIYPPYEQWRNDQGLTYRDLKHHQEALVAADRAIRLNVQDASAYQKKGDTLVAFKRYQEALAAYDQAIRLDPQNAFAYKKKGDIFANLQRYEEALVAYDQAIHLQPQETSPYIGKGGVFMSLKRYEEALVVYDQAIHHKPREVSAYLKKGYAFNHLKRYEEALDTFEQAIQVDPQNGDAYTSKGHALMNLERYAEALVAFEIAIPLGGGIMADVGKDKALKQMRR